LGGAEGGREEKKKRKKEEEEETGSVKEKFSLEGEDEGFFLRKLMGKRVFEPPREESLG